MYGSDSWPRAEFEEPGEFCGPFGGCEECSSFFTGGRVTGWHGGGGCEAGERMPVSALFLSILLAPWSNDDFVSRCIAVGNLDADSLRACARRART